MRVGEPQGRRCSQVSGMPGKAVLPSSPPLEACPFRGTYTVPSHFRALNWHITVPVASSTILKDVEWMSRGRVMLSTGTLYGALRRLLDQGWIERFHGGESPRDRRAYRLTSQGRRNLQLEVQRMRHLTKLATARVARREA